MTGETPTLAANYAVPEHREFRDAFIGFTVGDAGGAVVLEPSDDERGIFYRHSWSASQHWDVSRCPGGGSRHPRGDEHLYARGDGGQLRDIVRAFDPRLATRAFAATGTTVDDYALFVVHQVTAPFADEMIGRLGFPPERVARTIEAHGNVASGTLPLALAWARDAGRVRRGDACCSWAGRRDQRGDDGADAVSAARSDSSRSRGGRSWSCRRSGWRIGRSRSSSRARPRPGSRAGVGRGALDRRDPRGARGADAAAARRVRRRQREQRRDGRPRSRWARGWQRRRRAAVGVRLAHEPEQGTGAAADTGMRLAIAAGARYLLRTDADSLPRPDWAARMVSRLATGAELVAGRMVDRPDEGRGCRRASCLAARRDRRGAYPVPKNRGPRYRTRFRMLVGSNVGIPRRHVPRGRRLSAIADRRAPRRSGADEPDAPGDRSDRQRPGRWSRPAPAATAHTACGA